MAVAEVTLRSLHRGLQRREAPEEVAAKVVSLLSIPPEYQHNFPRRRSTYATSMSDDWARPKGLDSQLEVLATLTGAFPPSGGDPRAIRGFLDLARGQVGMRIGSTSYKHDRMNREARRVAGLGEMSRRRYDKLFRLIGRIEGYVGELEDQLDLTSYAQFAKVGFGAEVPYKAFAQADASAAFVAYYVANLGRRSLFTAGKQARALDRGAEFLLRLCESDARTSWFAVAHVFPRWDVLMRCTLEERAELLAKALAKLTAIAERLHACVTPTMDVDDMVVRRGDDSSTWNALAGAWNKARDAWISAAWSVDPTVAESLLPGKVMRLMAADVVAWHRSTNGLDPDTKVWQALPRPWDVLSGQATCTRDDVVTACLRMSVDPEKSGWAKPRPRTEVAEVRATPESVHGVVVSHPQLAKILRRAGWFSGYEKRVREVAPAIAAAGVEERAAHHAGFGPWTGDGE